MLQINALQKRYESETESRLFADPQIQDQRRFEKVERLQYKFTHQIF